MFAANPSLRSAGTLTSEQAVFVAAHIAHLLLDLRWFHEILVPFLWSIRNGAMPDAKSGLHRTMSC